MAEEECVLPLYIEEDHTEEAEAADLLKRQQASAASKKMKKWMEERAWRLKSEVETARWAEKQSALTEKITALDPKTGSLVTYRFAFCDLTRFNLDEESPVQPMRHSSYLGSELVSSANVLSAAVLASDVGYPVNVYGTVLVRDELDHRCIYLFRRHRDNPQLVNSKDEPLTLTGPSRGLVMFGSLYFEIDLKIRCKQEANDTESDDRDFSKGFLKEYAAISAGKIIRNKFISKLSTIELTYAHVERAVEGTVQIKILKGPAGSYSVQSSSRERVLSSDFKKGEVYFCGKITACTTGIPIDIILYDSKVSGNLIKVDDDGYIKLSRSVIAVPVDQALLLTVAAAHGECEVDRSTDTVDFIPEICSGVTVHFSYGSYVMRVSVCWSTLYASQVDVVSDEGAICFG